MKWVLKLELCVILKILSTISTNLFRMQRPQHQTRCKRYYDNKDKISIQQ